MIVERWAMQVFKTTGIAPEPLVPVDQIARALGVDVIIEAGLVEDGRLEQGPEVTTILLNQQVGLARKRFTLCHELGHLILATPNEIFTAHRSPAAPDREERLCDQFAAALLMPRLWVRDTFWGSPERLAVARTVARECGASLSASVVRLREVVGWRRSLLHWRRVHGSWRLTSTVGVPRAVHNRITSSDETRWILDSLRSSGSEERRGMLPLVIGGHDARLPVEVSVGSASAVALAYFGDTEGRC